MTGTIASVLRAPAMEWPEILARETRHQARAMNDDVTVTFPRAEYEAALTALRRADDGAVSDEGGLSLHRLDLRSAIRSMEAAARRGSLRLA